jgi:hypothetical protein
MNPETVDRGRVLAAQNAFRKGGDTRAIKRELARGNPYVVAALRARGLEYVGGAIRRIDN